MPKEEKINPMVEASKKAFQEIYIPDYISENYTFKFERKKAKVRKIPKNCKTTIERDDGMSVLKIGVGVNDDMYIQINHYEPVFINKESGSNILNMLYIAKQQKEKTTLQKSFVCKNANTKILFAKHSENNLKIQISLGFSIRTYWLADIDELISIFENIEKFLRPKKASLRRKK